MKTLRELAEISQKADLHVKYDIVTCDGVDLLITVKKLGHAISISHEFIKDPDEKEKIRQLAEKKGVELRGIRRKDK